MNLKQGLTPIILIIIAAVFLGGGYIAYRAAQQLGVNYQPPTTGSLPQEKQASADTSDWKTYRNEEYGFEFRYPPHRIVNLLKSGDIVFVGYGSEYLSGNDATYPFRVVKFTGSLDSFIKEFKNTGSLPKFNRILNSEQLSFGATTGTKLLTNTASDSPVYYVFFDRGNYNLILSYRGQEEEQILSTFKFFKSTDIIDWKTYTNDEYGYEFKYPPVLHVNRSSYANPGRVLFLTQEKTEPKISFGDLCGNAKDYIEFTNYHDITNGGQYSDIDSEILVVTKAYEKNGGKKIFDESVDRIRTVKYTSGISGQPIPSHIKKFNGNELIDIAYVSCAGGDIPIDLISSTFKFTK